MLHVHLHRPDRASLEFALKAAVASVLAIWASRALGLRDSYWAGISAVVATAGTLGATVGAATSRIAATVIGLLVGLGAVALPVSGTLLSGATVFVAIVVLFALSLDAGARLGAATTLIVTAVSSQSAVGDALSRGANVPLGCAITVLLGFVLLPHRGAERLRVEVREDVARAGALAHSALLAYAGHAQTLDLAPELQALIARSGPRAGALRDAGREPGERGARLHELERLVHRAGLLVDRTSVLVGLALEAEHDTASALVCNQLLLAGEALEAGARIVARPADVSEPAGALGPLQGAIAALDTALAATRERRATVGYATDEITRLLSVVRATHDVASAVNTFAPRAA